MSSLRMQLKAVVANLVYSSGLFRIKLNRLDKDKSLAIMYHRIIPRSKAGHLVQPGMYVEPDTFDLQITFFKKYFDIRSITEMYEPAPLKQASLRKKHTCYLTFDDGWSDFYNFAYPILLKHQIPATVYLPTGYIGTTNKFWSDRIANVLDTAIKNNRFDEVRNCIGVEIYRGSDDLPHSAEDCLDAVLLELKKYRIENIIGIIDKLEQRFNVLPSAEHNDFLSWKQIKEMQESGLVTFGSHTVSHRILTTLNDGEIENELYESKKCLVEKNIVDGDKVSFCYPNGNYNAAVLKHFEYIKYSFALSTKNGWNSPTTPVLELRRMGLHQDVSSSIPLLAYRIFKTQVI